MMEIIKFRGNIRLQEWIIRSHRKNISFGSFYKYIISYCKYINKKLQNLERITSLVVNKNTITISELLYLDIYLQQDLFIYIRIYYKVL